MQIVQAECFTSVFPQRDAYCSDNTGFAFSHEWLCQAGVRKKKGLSGSDRLPDKPQSVFFEPETVMWMTLH